MLVDFPEVETVSKGCSVAPVLGGKALKIDFDPIDDGRCLRFKLLAAARALPKDGTSVFCFCFFCGGSSGEIVTFSSRYPPGCKPEPPLGLDELPLGLDGTLPGLDGTLPGLDGILPGLDGTLPGEIVTSSFRYPPGCKPELFLYGALYEDEPPLGTLL